MALTVPRPGRLPSDHRIGFTMIELILVLAIVSVLASFAAPVINPGRWRSDSAVQEVMVALNAAQRLAVLRQHDMIITFRVNERLLRIHRDVDNDGVVDTGEDMRVVELPETIGFARGSSAPIDGASDDVSFTDTGAGPALVFHRNGSASEAGAAYLRPMEGSLAHDSEATRAITVERATGQVRCFTYRTGSWEASC